MSGKGSPGRVATDLQKKRASDAMRRFHETHPEARKMASVAVKDWIAQNPEKFKSSQQAGGQAAAKSKTQPVSLLNLSKRTMGKILKRLNIGCSRCGWSEAPCDVHHIRGRNVPDPHNHQNLTYLCPNCHRLAHHGKIRLEALVSLDVQIGDRWKALYFPQKAGINFGVSAGTQVGL